MPFTRLRRAGVRSLAACLTLATVLLGCGAPFAQEADSAWQLYPPGVTQSVYGVHEPGAGTFQGARVQPGGWFVGLPYDRVEVLLYDEGIGRERLTLEGAGASLGGVTSLPNENYLIATVEVAADAAPGELTFRASGGRSYPWTLARPKQPRALSPADLIYLIMPDRFANGDTANDSVEGMSQTGVDRGKFLYRHGGDLAGVTQRLDYLAGLGVTTLWLNPVLENDQPYASYHGYAVTDHYRIDRRLGDLDSYRALVDGAHARDMKVLMDIVPNHAGDAHFLYADIPARDWFHQPDSFTRSNFRIPSLLDPHAAPSDRAQMLDGWFDRHMPDFDQSNPHVRTYLTQAALWWIAATGQDGYRVDTYPYADPAFMAAWSETIRANFPTVSFFGEVWTDGLPHQAGFVPGVESPLPRGASVAVTDFQVYPAILEALTAEQTWAGGVGKLWLTLTQDWMYRDPNALVTFVDNHDLTRLATVLEGDTTRIQSALTLLLTLRGTPMINYGTELGMEGAGGGFGEGGRKDFPGGWPDDPRDAFSEEQQTLQQRAIYRHVRDLAVYRRANPGLATGDFTHYVPEDGVYVYFRTAANGRRWMVAFNSNDERATLDTSRFRALIGARELSPVVGEGSLNLAGKSACVWELK